MKFNARIFAALLLAAALIFTQAGCAGQADNNPDPAQEQRQEQSQVQSKNRNAARVSDSRDSEDKEDAVIRLKRHHGVKYVPLRTLSDTLEFQSEWNPAKAAFSIGGNDIMFEFRVNSNEVTVEGEVVELQHPVVEIDGETFIPEEAVDEVFGQAMHYYWTKDALNIRPNPDPGLGNADDLPDFAEDPGDPNPRMSASALTAMDASTLKSIDADSLIDTAKKYIGVSYKFGATYPQSKLFDCSSFTQYVFEKHGIKLPRLSINQSKQGIAVSRSNLRKGDLLFFYWPGRYRSKNIVGHVGIYIGDGKMIHSSPVPKDGVQISGINEPRWKKTFLKARRVAS